MLELAYIYVYVYHLQKTRINEVIYSGLQLINSLNMTKPNTNPFLENYTCFLQVCNQSQRQLALFFAHAIRAVDFRRVGKIMHIFMSFATSNKSEYNQNHFLLKYLLSVQILGLTSPISLVLKKFKKISYRQSLHHSLQG